jgi:cytochrome c
MARAVALLSCAAAAPTAAPAFTVEQAERGEAHYNAQCATCHGFGLEGKSAPALIGADVMQNFDTAAGLYDFISVAMPPQAPGMLGEQAYLDILAHILKINGAREGGALNANPDVLASINLSEVTDQAAAQAASKQAAIEGRRAALEVPQAFTFGQELPVVQSAAEAPKVPQAYTFGQPLPTVAN